MSIRSVGYSQEEDKFLCLLYIEITQDPITSVYQTSDQFWSRIEEGYNNAKDALWSERSKRSLQSRIQSIERATRKLHACIKQCENRRPSGASTNDILDQAKQMMSEDPLYKRGYKFDHVWIIVKKNEKFKDGNTRSQEISKPPRYVSSGSENLTPEPSQASPGLSAFSLNLDDSDEVTGGSPSERPSGVKKSKMKRKNDDQIASAVNTIDEGNKQILDQLRNSSAQRQRFLDNQSKNYALKEVREENKMLLHDVSSIVDPNVRAFVRAEQTRIIAKRVEQQNQQTPPTSSSYEPYFNIFGGSGSGLPDF